MRRLSIFAFAMIVIVQAFGGYAFSTKPVLARRSDPFGSSNLYARSGGSKKPKDGNGQGSPSRERATSQGSAQSQGQSGQRQLQAQAQASGGGGQQSIAQALAERQAQRQAERQAQRVAQSLAQPTPRQQAQALSQAFGRVRAQQDSLNIARAHARELNRSSRRGEAQGQGQTHALVSALQSHSSERYREVGNRYAPIIAQTHTGFRQVMSDVTRAQARVQQAIQKPTRWIKHLEDVQAGRTPNRANLSQEEISRRIQQMRDHVESFTQHQDKLTDLNLELSEEMKQFEPGPGRGSGPGPGPSQS